MDLTRPQSLISNDGNALSLRNGQLIDSAAKQQVQLINLSSTHVFLFEKRSVRLLGGAT